ncbi:MAG: hypothetical protein AAB619_00055 [Patescibacteria group bacterium]
MSQWTPAQHPSSALRDERGCGLPPDVFFDKQCTSTEEGTMSYVTLILGMFWSVVTLIVVARGIDVAESQKDKILVVIGVTLLSIMFYVAAAVLRYFHW